MRILHLAILVLKICFEASSRIIIFSCCLYVTNGGQFSSIQTLGFFYLMLSILIMFHTMFNRSPICSWENWIGKEYSLIYFLVIHILKVLSLIPLIASLLLHPWIMLQFYRILEKVWSMTTFKTHLRKI